MIRTLYISIYSTVFNNRMSDGVMNKIELHFKCLQSYGNSVDYISNDGRFIYFHTNDEKIKIGKSLKPGYRYFNKMMVLTMNFLKKRKYKYDYIYIRHCAFDFFGFAALKYLHKISNCIYLEIPTYSVPNPTLKNYIKYYFNKHLFRYVHRIVVDCLEPRVYNIPTLFIPNGTDLSKISVRNPTYTDVINVLLVAYIQDYHGVDKIINAVSSYNKNNGNRKIIFHIVGDGPKLQEYIALCEREHLEKQIIFYGRLTGESLYKVFDKCEIGISSLSNKELGITCSSTLKSKEYLAKGIPVISDTMLDVFVGCNRYFFHELEKTFTVSEVISFYDSVYNSNKDRLTIIEEIRSFAESTCDMYKVFYKVQEDYMEYLAMKRSN